MSNKPDKPLIQHSKETYGESFQAHLLEQYKLYVQSADNVSARRIASIHYLLAINTAIIALYGVLVSTLGHTQLLIAVPTTGGIISILWFFIIKSHKDLNTVKFKVIQEIEQHLPSALYEYEWQMLEEGKGKSYEPITKIEAWIPSVFLIFHAILILLTVYTIQGTIHWVR